MEVNITLFLQILQFVSVYYFLYKFVFAPACKILEKNEQIEGELYKNLNHEQQVKDALVHDYYAKNNIFKSMLLQEIPVKATQLILQKTKFNSTLHYVSNNKLSEQDRQKTESFLVNRLSQVIKND